MKEVIDLVQMTGDNIPNTLVEAIEQKIKDGLGNHTVKFVWIHNSQRRKNQETYTYFYPVHFTVYNRLIELINGLIQSNLREHKAVSSSLS